MEIAYITFIIYCKNIYVYRIASCIIFLSPLLDMFIAMICVVFLLVRGEFGKVASVSDCFFLYFLFFSGADESVFCRPFFGADSGGRIVFGDSPEGDGFPLSKIHILFEALGIPASPHILMNRTEHWPKFLHPFSLPFPPFPSLSLLPLRLIPSSQESPLDLLRAHSSGMQVGTGADHLPPSRHVMERTPRSTFLGLHV